MGFHCIVDGEDDDDDDIDVMKYVYIVVVTARYYPQIAGKVVMELVLGFQGAFSYEELF